MLQQEHNNFPPGQQAPQTQVIQPGQQQFVMQPGQHPQYVVQTGGGQQQIVMHPGQQQVMMHSGQQQVMMHPGQQPVMQPGQMPMQGGPMMSPQAMWMVRPEAVGDCPPGLEYLTQLDQLLVKQQMEMMEVLTNLEMKNRYIVRNTLGQQIYFAHEDSDTCYRQCCGSRRPFTLHIEDNMGQRVIQLERPFKWICCGQCCSCSECCKDEIEVQAPPGEVVGYVKQIYEGCDAQYAIMDAHGNVALRIKGPSYCHCHCPGDDIPFTLTSVDGEHEVGKISKQWSNLMREYFTDADNFGIQFPIDLDVRVKAVVLGAVFLIDFMYFENNQQRRR